MATQRYDFSITGPDGLGGTFAYRYHQTVTESSVKTTCGHCAWKAATDTTGQARTAAREHLTVHADAAASMAGFITGELVPMVRAMRESMDLARMARAAR